MTEATVSRGGYQPTDPIQHPPLYDWPPRPVVTLRWIVTGLMFPWGFFLTALAVVTWNWLTPATSTMQTLSPGWMGLIWLRNAVLLTIIAGVLHWWLYIRRSQDLDYKFNVRWPATDSRKFLWRNQVKDNMFWSLASGVTVWSLYESLTMWLWADGRIPRAEWGSAPLYLGLLVLGVFFWGTTHFYLNHRLLHWEPLYRAAHERHHRNTNTGPWTGISMHPIEHLVYFTVFLLWWVVPAHPVIFLMTGFFNGISPSITHSGFDQVVLGGRFRITAGDQFHHLHHRYFEVNYGNTPSPIDKLAGSWHDGTPEAHELFKDRRRAERT
ncbi:MAG: sterol desaturase family protein [Acidimicrobiales bacterium]|nr:sterol desaturase family protein [Acidimicrobiales bacterium]